MFRLVSKKSLTILPMRLRESVTNRQPGVEEPVPSVFWRRKSANAKHRVCRRQVFADTVEKVFLVPQRATLIQTKRRMRNIDSRIASLRFDCCEPTDRLRLFQQHRPSAEVAPTDES
jgi:hypothetical protein